MGRLDQTRQGKRLGRLGGGGGSGGGGRSGGGDVASAEAGATVGDDDDDDGDDRLLRHTSNPTMRVSRISPPPKLITVPKMGTPKWPPHRLLTFTCNAPPMPITKVAKAVVVVVVVVDAAGVGVTGGEAATMTCGTGGAKAAGPGE